MNKRAKGHDGETLAVNFLLENGYKIISRNYQSRIGEIDIIAVSANDELIFIEVKSGSNKYGHPFYRVTKSKQNAIFRMAQLYLIEHNFTDITCRFDVIAVLDNGKIEHLKNAFLF